MLMFLCLRSSSSCPSPGWAAGQAASNALINQSGEKAGVDRGIAPFGIKGCGRLGRHDLIPRSPFFLKDGDIFPDGDEHIAEFLELGFVADGMTVSWNDDCLIGRYRQVGVGSTDHSVDTATSLIFDGTRDALPIST